MILPGDTIVIAQEMLDDPSSFIRLPGSLVSWAGCIFELGEFDLLTSSYAARMIEIGTCFVTSVHDRRIKIVTADRYIAVAPEFIEMIAAGHTVGVTHDLLSQTITMTGVNRTVRYQLTGFRCGENVHIAKLVDL